jgi:hypothetical protein
MRRSFRDAFAASFVVVAMVSCAAISGVNDLTVCAFAECEDAGALDMDAVSDANDDGASNLVSIGGSVSNLLGKGLVLENGARDDLPISANGPFNFPSKARLGDSYAVTVSTQPTDPSQICSVDNGAGTVTGGDVTNVAIKCSTIAYSVGGVVVGTAAATLLTNNGGDDVAINAGETFTFKTKVPSGLPFDVAIKKQPTSGGPCDVSGATGTVGDGDVTSVVVNCEVGTFTVGGTIKGITGTVILQNNGGNDTKVTSNGTFAFSKTLPPASTYAVTVLTQPDYPPKSQTCIVAKGTGTTASANVTDVEITCTTNSFTIGGNLTSLKGPSLVLKNNGGDSLTLTANGPFTFATSEPSGSTYAVTVGTPPPAEACTIKSGNGTVTKANVTDVSVECGLDPGIRCGASVYCSIPSFCCLDRAAGSGTCVVAGGACGAQPIHCDDAVDCGATSVCCARYNKANGQLRDAICETSPAACAQSAGNNSTTELWCDPAAAAPCPAGMACTGNANTSGYKKCQ